MISTCLNDRFAHILTDTGITSNFPMKVSVMQGDKPSTKLFKNFKISKRGGGADVPLFRPTQKLAKKECYSTVPY